VLLTTPSLAGGGGSRWRRVYRRVRKQCRQVPATRVATLTRLRCQPSTNCHRYSHSDDTRLVSGASAVTSIPELNAHLPTRSGSTFLPTISNDGGVSSTEKSGPFWGHARRARLPPSGINLVPASAGKVTVGLASHWPCVTYNNSGTTTYGLTALVGEMNTPPTLQWSMELLAFTLPRHGRRDENYRYAGLRQQIRYYLATAGAL